MKSGIAVNMSAITVPGGKLKGLDEEKVAEHRESLRARRELPPIRLNAARELVYGAHRYAAAKAEKAKKIRADIVEYDSLEEQEADAIGENLRRRVLTPEERRRDVARLSVLLGNQVNEAPSQSPKHAEEKETAPRNLGQMSVIAPPVNKAKARAGRPPSPKGARAKGLAAVTGTSAKTARRDLDAIERDAELENVEPAPAEPAALLPPCIRSFGLSVPSALDGKARRVQRAIDEADKLLRSLAKLVNGLEADGVPEKFAQAVRTALGLAADGIRGLRPESLCPWCKGFAGVADCYFCSGGGYASAALMKRDIPADLMLEGPAAMVANGTGRFRKVTPDVMPEPPKRGLGGRSLTVELVDPETGEVVRVESEDDIEVDAADEELAF